MYRGRCRTLCGRYVTSVAATVSPRASSLAALWGSSARCQHTSTHQEDLINADLKEELLKVGDWAELKKTFKEEDVKVFASLSEDHNPIHLCPEYASASRFGKRVVHGMLTSALFSAILGTKLPGKGSIYLSQTLSFKAPIFLDEEVTARVEVVNVHETKPVVTFTTQCFNPHGKLCVDGQAVVFVPHHAGVSRNAKKRNEGDN